MFRSLIETQILDMGALTERSAPFIDNRAEVLVKILYCAFEGSAKKSLPHNKGQPWWDQSCKEAKRNYREICRLHTPSYSDKKAFKSVINRAKSNFYQKKLSEASSAKDAFEISKWHKSKGHFRMPALKNPLLPENPPAVTLEEKRNVFF